MMADIPSRDEALRLLRQYCPVYAEHWQDFSPVTLTLIVRDIEASEGLPWRTLLGYPTQPVLSQQHMSSEERA